ncbi:XdhC family protein [soil metagenome]
MENVDLIVLRALRDWRRAGKRAWLVTVVKTWGSSPRPTGSIMAFSGDGAVVGSVSGGCIEDDLLARRVHAPQHAEATSPNPVEVLTYGIASEDAHKFGLPCGGTLELVVERDPDPVALAALVIQLESGRLMRRAVCLVDGAVRLSPAVQPEELHVHDGWMTCMFGPEYRMLMIGAGQLSEYLATMAIGCGFAVTVCDPRREYGAAWSVAGVTLDSRMPDDVVASFRADRRSCIVALTHDPKLDDLALIDALQTEAFYVGAIGSRRNNEARQARLREHFDMSEADLLRLRGPIGLYIGSKTPPEIAVSVMAEILATKNGVAMPASMQVRQAKDMRSLAGMTV